MIDEIVHIVESFDFDKVEDQSNVIADKIYEDYLNKLQEDNPYVWDKLMGIAERISAVCAFFPKYKDFLKVFVDKTVDEKHTYKVQNKDELISIMMTILARDPNANLNFLDVSNIDDMSELFSNNPATHHEYLSQCNPDISEWNVSNVTNMANMFYKSKFNGDISKWDVSNCKNMYGMFAWSEFNGDISKWDVGNCNILSTMFSHSKFNGDLSKWNLPCVNTMYKMFSNNKAFNGDISKWNVRNCLNFNYMFSSSVFNQDISNWNVSRCRKFKGMFAAAKFNHDISEWDIDPRSNCDAMFAASEIKQEYKPKAYLAYFKDIDQKC